MVDITDAALSGATTGPAVFVPSQLTNTVPTATVTTESPSSVVGDLTMTVNWVVNDLQQNGSSVATVAMGGSCVGTGTTVGPHHIAGPRNDGRGHDGPAHHYGRSGGHPRVHRLTTATVRTFVLVRRQPFVRWPFRWPFRVVDANAMATGGSAGAALELFAVGDRVATIVLFDPAQPHERGDRLVHPFA